MKRENHIKIIKCSLLIIISVFFAILVFVGLEIVLRASGKQPAKLIDRKKEGEPAIFEKDSILGWKCRPGVYDRWPKSWENSSGIKVTIWLDGSRATRPAAIIKDKQIIIIGCSFAFGWAISDEQTFAWKVQEEFPDIEFLNYSANGYGTYQSLLSLERYFKHNPDAKPLMILYGFSVFHEDRNVASFKYIRGMRVSNRVDLCVPYCRINGMGILERKPPPLPMSHGF